MLRRSYPSKSGLVGVWCGVVWCGVLGGPSFPRRLIQPCSANTEVARIRQDNDHELALLRAKLQRSEVKIKTQEQTIQQKETENGELMAICDELIGKMEVK